jgi:hypothetical protein
VANTLHLFRNGAAERRVLCFTLVGFIDWLDPLCYYGDGEGGSGDTL